MLEHVSHRVNSSSLALTIRNEIAAALSRLIRQPPLDATQDAHLGHHQQFRVTTPVTGIDSSSVFHNSLSTHSHVVNMDSVPGFTAVQPSSQLPAIPSQVLERIRRCEFVNFDLLLPNNVPSQTLNTYKTGLKITMVHKLLYAITCRLLGIGSWTYIPGFWHGACFSRLPLFFVHIWYPKC